MFHRDRQPELMDDPNLPTAEHRKALAGLTRLNRFSGIAGTMYRRLRRYAGIGGESVRILDVASGAGDIPIAWAKRAQREGFATSITAMDISEIAAEEQQKRARQAGVEIESVVQDCIKRPLPSGFDVITCSLFMHHLEDHDAQRLLQSMQSAAGRAILICDLDRSITNMALVGCASRLLSRSSVVHTDALRSVRGAYTRDEFKSLAEEALLCPVLVERSMPCRFLAIIDEATVPAEAMAFA